MIPRSWVRTPCGPSCCVLEQGTVLVTCSSQPKCTNYKLSSLAQLLVKGKWAPLHALKSAPPQKKIPFYLYKLDKIIIQIVKFVSQVRKPIKVEREPYTGPVWTPDGVKPGENKAPPSPTKSSGQPINRQTKGGHRDLHASGFDLSGKILCMSEMNMWSQGPWCETRQSIVTFFETLCIVQVSAGEKMYAQVQKDRVEALTHL